MTLSNPAFHQFRNVDGETIQLEKKGENKVKTFVIHRKKTLHSRSELAKLLFLALCFFVNKLIFTLIFGVAFLWKYFNFITSVTTETLLVVESVGVQIVSERKFFGLDTSEFLPWNIIQDIFINEVIIERRVLYYLTFIVEDVNQEKKSVRLVPLFRKIRPERKCLEYIYNQLAPFIKPSKKS